MKKVGCWKNDKEEKYMGPPNSLWPIGHQFIRTRERSNDRGICMTCEHNGALQKITSVNQFNFALEYRVYLG